jgi:hypothetical protein
MITTSEGQFFPEPGTGDTLPVRIWSAAVDAEYIALKISGHDELHDVNVLVYLQAEDTLNLAEELQEALERQKRWRRVQLS